MVKIKWGIIIRMLIGVSIFCPPAHAADNSITPTDAETYSGQLEVIAADNFETHASQRLYSIRVTQEDGSYRTYALSFEAGPPDRDLQTGDTVSIQGRLSQNTIAVDSLQQATGARAADRVPTTEIYSEAPPPMEVRRAVVLIVSLADVANPHTVDSFAAELYTNDQSVDGLYRASSYQQLSFDPDTDGDGNPDIFGPFVIGFNDSDGCNEMDWALAADEAATAAGIDLSQYQHKVYALPPDVQCNWAGLASIGCVGDRCRVWVKSNRGEYIAHELGHNIGWRHATTDPDNDGNVDVEYGDESGIMGMPFWAQANAPHRDQKSWFDAFPGTLVSPTCGDTFSLDALELDPGVDTVGIQVVKIRKPDTHEFYYLSYRRQIGAYPSTSEYAGRVNVHRYDDNASYTHHITNLERDDQFEDTANGITVTATAAGGARATVVVDLPNETPEANFSYTANHLEVRFNDSSDDPDGGVESYLWDFGDGTTSNEVDPRHTYTEGGTFRVRLTVTDTCGDTHSRRRDITLVPNNRPDAAFAFSADKLAVSFSNASTDSDGEITSRRWDFGDGSSANDTDPSHTYAEAGTYQVTLTVTDDDGDRDTATQPVTVVANVAPTASFSYSTDVSFVQFDNQSTDSDGSIVSHQWDFGDGSTSDEVAPTHTFATSGTFTVTLTVRDDDGVTHSDAQNITVTAPITPAAMPDFSFNINGLSVQFTDSSTGSIDSYTWDFGDGVTSAEDSPGHTYGAAGTYTVGLTVTNAAGSNTVTKDVTVPSVTHPDFTFTANGLDVQYTDSSTGSSYTCTWNFGDGATSTECSPGHTYGTAGTYTVELTVTDAAGSNTVTKDVSVSSTAPITPTAQSSGGGGGGGCFIRTLH